MVARLQTANPGEWVLKGGMALEVRLGDDARLTKDIDFGLRADVATAADVHDLVVGALLANQADDGFELSAAAPQLLGTDGTGHVTWRLSIAATLASRLFGGTRIDVSPRAYELVATEHLALPNSLAFADIPPVVAEVVDVNRHAAEKLHAMFRDFGDRENTRVRDLVDLVLMVEHDLISPHGLADPVVQVWSERDGADPPDRVPPLPSSWPPRYERMAAENELGVRSFTDAVAMIEHLWAEIRAVTR